MDQLTRIEKLLERIAVALEKMEEPEIINIKQDSQLRDIDLSYKCHIDHFAQGFGVDYSMMGDDKTADTCKAKFDNIERIPKWPFKGE